MAFTAPQVPAEPSYQVSSWLIFTVVGWVLLYGIVFFPFILVKHPMFIFLSR